MIFVFMMLIIIFIPKNITENDNNVFNKLLLLIKLINDFDM